MRLHRVRFNWELSMVGAFWQRCLTPLKHCVLFGYYQTVFCLFGRRSTRVCWNRNISLICTLIICLLQRAMHSRLGRPWGLCLAAHVRHWCPGQLWRPLGVTGRRLLAALVRHWCRRLAATSLDCSIMTLLHASLVRRRPCRLVITIVVSWVSAIV